MSRGKRLSPYLLNSMLEVLARGTAHTKNKGIQTSNKEFKVFYWQMLYICIQNFKDSTIKISIMDKYNN